MVFTSYSWYLGDQMPRIVLRLAVYKESHPQLYFSGPKYLLPNIFFQRQEKQAACLYLSLDEKFDFDMMLSASIE